ncbi:MAG TPA: trigger factor [Candidatus Kapabacteria bacterium]|nr:trigger factor [Ignavibacteria bacterium]HRE58141.1 trigger factor [Candidatus Kapabacteria bacterium]HRK59487.1 trigger factor [Candidatus Kapabacteria bacterium]
METNVEVKNDSTRIVSFTLTATDLKPHYEQAYKNAQRDFQLPGFRRGKVPMPMIKARFGKSIEIEYAGEIANEEFRKFVEANNIELMGSPKLVDIKHDDFGGVSISVEYQVIPVVNVEGYTGLSLRKPMLTVSDDDVDAQMDKLRLENSTIESAETIENSLSHVDVEWQELNPETDEPLADSKPETAHYFLDSDNMDSELRDTLIGKKLHDVFTWVGEAENPDDLPPRYSGKITRVQKVVLPDLTDEYATQISGGRFVNVADLAADVRSFLVRGSETKVREELETQIVSIMTDKIDVIPPDALVEHIAKTNWDEFKKQQKLPKKLKFTGEIKSFFMAQAMRTAKWELISTKIMQDEALEVTDADFDDTRTAIRSISPDSDVESVIQRLRQDDKYMMGVLHKKVFDLIIEKAILNEVPAEEFYDESFMPRQFDDALAMMGDAMESDEDSDIGAEIVNDEENQA